MKIILLRRSHIFFLLLFSLFLAACVPVTPEPQTTFDVTLSDSAIMPRKLWVQAGTTIDLNIKNDDRSAHSLALLEAFIDPPFNEDKQSLVIFDQVVQADEQVNIQFTAPAAAGEYQIISTQPGDMEAGLQAKLIVIRP